jgi:hypothetical protein
VKGFEESSYRLKKGHLNFWCNDKKEESLSVKSLVMKFLLQSAVLIIFFKSFSAYQYSEQKRNQLQVEKEESPEKFKVDYKRYDQETNEYFDEIVMYSEFSDSRRHEPYRWSTDMKIFVDGEKPDYLIAELNQIVMELNDLIDPIQINIVYRKQDANYFIFFGSKVQFADRYSLIDESKLERNWGYFEIYPGGGVMYVDLDRTSGNLFAQKHLLREELTQSLGLLNDSWKYPESIFYQGWTTTTEFSEMDIKLIDLLYNN